MDDAGSAPKATSIEGLRRAGLLDRTPDPNLDRITRLAAKLLKTPASAVTLIDYPFERQVFISSIGLPEAIAERRETPLTYSICERVAKTGAMLVVADARKEDWLKTSPARKALGVAAYLGAPLFAKNGECYGALCVIDRRVRKWSEADQANLADLAALVVREIEARQDLSERERAEARLGESEEDFRTLANFLPHIVWMSDAKGEIYWFNQRWFDYTGLSPDGPPARTMVHPDHYERIAGRFLEHMTSGEPWEDVVPMRGMDGAYRWFLSRAMPKRDASGRVVRWFGANTDITERLEAEDRQKLLMREVDHRAKNALAVVQAVVRLSRADDPADFQAAVEGRIVALARSHALLAESRWRGVDLEKLLRDEVAPYVGVQADRALVYGPSYLLFPETAQTMALVLHELATNAAKHGALAQPNGRLRVEWDVLPDGGLSLAWTETLERPAAPAKRTGFGSSLFAQSIERHLGGSYEMDLRPSGLICRLRGPARPAAQQGLTKAKKAQRMPNKSRVLLVEDDALIAMEMEERLAEMGYEVIGPAATIEAAEQAAAQETPDIALLDANLRGRTTVDLGAALAARGVRVAFCTGYEEVKGLPPQLQGAPVLTKPVADEDLRATLKKLAPQEPA